MPLIPAGRHPRWAWGGQASPSGLFVALGGGCYLRSVDMDSKLYDLRTLVKSKNGYDLTDYTPTANGVCLSSNALRALGDQLHSVYTYLRVTAESPHASVHARADSR